MLSVGGCVRDAVLENDVRRAQLESTTLGAQSDFELAEAALASELVELEALYGRAPGEKRVLPLLVLDYFRLAEGFIEARRLEALAAGDAAMAKHQQERQADARARRDYYGKLAKTGGVDELAPADRFTELLAAAERACKAKDRARYETELTALLAKRAGQPGERLRWALARRLAQSWLRPEVSARCQF